MHTSIAGSMRGSFRKKKWRRKKMSGKNKFRALARQVIENRSWLGVVGLSEEDLGDNIRANVQIIKSKASKHQLQMRTEKVILRKHPDYRTEEEKEILFKTLGNLKCFRRYPEDVRKELVAHTYFEYFGPNRTLIRQGHKSTFMAVLLTGELNVFMTYIDPVFGKQVTEKKGTMVSGTMVGEISLVYNTARTATVVTSTAVELLTLKKEDFDLVLKDTLQAQWDDVKSALTKFSYFKSFDANAIRECCIMSDIKQYKEEEIIYSSRSKKNMSHFILKGKCTVMQKIIVEENGDSFRLYKDQSITYLLKNLHCVCMQSCILSEGACFGIGEDLSDRTIIAATDVDILRMPFYILQENNSAQIWTRIKIFQQSRIPSVEQLFQKFMVDRKWEKYRKREIAKMKVNKSQNYTTFHDVPLSYRVQTMHPDEYKRSNRYRSILGLPLSVQRSDDSIRRPNQI